MSVKHTDITWNTDMHPVMAEKFTNLWHKLATDVQFDDMNDIQQDYILQFFRANVLKALANGKKRKLSAE